MSGRLFEKFELIKRVLAHGRFVLHGSNVDDLRWIEPRAPLTFGRGDGPTGVYATEEVATAIFFAVLNRKRVRWCAAQPGAYALDLHEGEASPWVVGAVYVLDRGDFEELAGNLISTSAVKAVGKVAVSIDDFPHLDRVQRLTREGWLATRSQ